MYNFNRGLIKPPLKLGHGWVITSDDFMWTLSRVRFRPWNPRLLRALDFRLIYEDSMDSMIDCNEEMN